MLKQVLMVISVVDYAPISHQTAIGTISFQHPTHAAMAICATRLEPLAQIIIQQKPSIKVTIKMTKYLLDGMQD